jgi:RNA 2',3'-cyclic 3'-phosphodiesterase
MMRVFFGLELEGTTALQVADWRDRHLACPGRPVPPSNFHITLAFIGPLSDPAIARLCLAVDEWLTRSTVTGATLHLDRTGYWHKPGIYWLGPTAWPEHLARLAQKLTSLASAVGAKQDRNPFQPHITLYRGCNAAPPAPTLTPAIDMTYRHCALFESRQGKQGVSYHVLQDWGLPSATI